MELWKIMAGIYFAMAFISLGMKLAMWKKNRTVTVDWSDIIAWVFGMAMITAITFRVV